VKYYQKCVKFASNYFKNSSVSGDFVPQTPTGAPPLDPAGGLPSPDSLWFPHPKPPSAAVGYRSLVRRVICPKCSCADSEIWR